MILKLKHFIGNTFHIKKWSDNYQINISFESFYDTYNYVVLKHKHLYKLLQEYCEHRGMICYFNKYNNKIYPHIKITDDNNRLPYKMMAYNKGTQTIIIHSNMLYKNPIEFRGLLVHEIIHHIYSTIHVSYGLFRHAFNVHSIGDYEKDPEEFIADYWRLCYEGYYKEYIIKRLAEWYFYDDKDCTITRQIVAAMEHYGFIPTTHTPIEAHFGLNERV